MIVVIIVLTRVHCKCQQIESIYSCYTRYLYFRSQKLFSAPPFSLQPLLFNHSFPSYPSILSYPPFLPTPPFFACLHPFVSLCYLLLLPFYSYPSFTSTSRFPSHIPFRPILPLLHHLSMLLLFSSPSFHRPPLLSSILFLPTSLPLPSPLSLSPFLSSYRMLSFSLFQFLLSRLLSFFSLLSPPYPPLSLLSLSPLPLYGPSLSYFSIFLSHIIGLCSIHNTVIYNST